MIGYIWSRYNAPIQAQQQEIFIQLTVALNLYNMKDSTQGNSHNKQANAMNKQT